MAMLLMAALAVVGVAAPAAAGSGGVELDTVVNGEALADADFGNPLPLGDELTADVEATITNRGTSPVEIRRIRLEGTAFGITFLAYDTVLPFVIEPGSSQTLTFGLPLDDLPDQANGLLPASMALYDSTGARIAAQDFTVEIAGSSTSIMGVFAMLTAALTGLAVALNAYLILKRRMPANRITRGIRFVVPGLGLGLLLTLLLAMGRILAPYPTVWPWLVLLPGAASFALGFLSPGALDLTDDVDEFDDLEAPRYRY